MIRLQDRITVGRMGRLSANSNILTWGGGWGSGCFDFCDFDFDC
jgi:hypothetical protein